MTKSSNRKLSAPSPDLGDDLAIARSTLVAALPHHLPTVEGVELATLYVPSKGLSGNLYDVIELSEELLAFVMFGVTDHGVAATLKASMAKVAFTNHIRSGISPRAVMNRVTADLTASLGTESFVSAFVGVLDLHSNRLAYTHHGQPCTAVFRARDQSVSVLKPTIPPPGSNRRVHEEKNVILNPGDWFVLFSAGFETIVSEGSGAPDPVFESSLADLIKAAGPTQCLKAIGTRWSGNGKAPGTDVAALAVEMQTVSRRNLLKKELGFEQGDPAYLQHLSYFEEMDKVIAIILRNMDNQGYADDTIRKMKITLTELLVNALHHGNRKDPTKKVTVGHMVDKNRTIISVLDEGDGFDPAKVPDPTLPENLIKDSGRGLYIVRCYVDDLLFNGKGNRVTIIKYGYGRR